MPKAKVGDINLSYKVRGDGYPLLMITGFGSSQNSILGLSLIFSKHYRVVTLDNRGIGHSDKPPGPYSIKMMADDTVGLLNFLEIDKVHLMGGSMGGMIAQQIAIEHPQRVNKMILFSTSADQRWLFDLAETITPNWNPSQSDLGSVDSKKLLIAMASRTSNQIFTKLVITALMKLQVRFGKLTGLNGQIEALKTHNVLDQLHTIKAPTLVLAGGKDRLIAPESSEILASQIPGAKLVIIDGGSHIVAGEKYGRFKKEVLGFLRGDSFKIPDSYRDSAYSPL